MCFFIQTVKKLYGMEVKNIYISKELLRIVDL
jgi:hypothetical protein